LYAHLGDVEMRAAIERIDKLAEQASVLTA
jgi:hypothetical protein